MPTATDFSKKVQRSATEASTQIESLGMSSLTLDRKYLLLEAIVRKMRLRISMKDALYQIDPTAEYVAVEIESLVFDHEEDKDETALLGLHTALLLSLSTRHSA